MGQKIERLKRLMIIAIVIQAALLLFLWLVLKQNVLFAAIILVAETGSAVLLFDRFERIAEEQSVGVKNALGTTAEQAYLSGGVGMIMYDDEYIVTWMSELFQERGIDRIGHKILTWIPEADNLIRGDSDSETVTIEDRYYEIRKSPDSQMIYFHDITDYVNYRDRYNEERVVIGLANFDNYEESTQYADDADVSAINQAVRTPLIEYCEEHHVLAKRLNNYRYLLVLDERGFGEIVADHFSILNRIRRVAQKMDVSITLSMAFARGSSNLSELDHMAVNLMDLAQTRGGDQVAIQAVGEEVKYFGGSTEAAEKRSKVRVRVMSHALRDLIQQSSNVIICGHKAADFDCIGSAICLSRMATALNKPVCIIAKTGGLDAKLAGAIKANEEELKDQVNFVTEGEALNQLKDTTLVIMTDHHNKKQSNGANVLESAKRVVVIDHHRRSTDMGVKPVLVYIEAGASSACELLTEMIPYISGRVDISETAATFMLAGMMIDTQGWKVRTGARTYEAASALRKLGGDPAKANDWNKDTYDEFEIKSAALAASERYPHGVVITAVTDRTMTRTLLSQVADTLLGIEGVRAAFVMGGTGNDTACSARSDGTVNVQRIMEKLGGGGHMTASACQRPKGTVDVLKSDLITALNEYFKEEQNDESNS